MKISSRATMRHLVSVGAFAAGLAVPAIASAQEPGHQQQPCPPGSWFCADAPQPQPAPPPPNQPAPGQPLQPLPPQGQAQGQPPPVVYQPAPAPPPPVVVYQPPPPVVYARPEAPPPYVYRPRVTYPRSQWGLNLHLEGAMIGKGANGDTSMGGLGFGLRYRMIPAFAVEANLDFVGGTDYQGLKRNETGLTFNGLVFLNPKSVAQVYLLGGFGWSGAHVQSRDYVYTTNYIDDHYTYFGGQAGIGLELRFSRHFALNGDIRGFIRGRVDDQAQYKPEFTDGTGRSTNTSGGGLLTLGATFYF